MRLYLCRHGEASADSASGDFGRALTGQGVEQARFLGAWIGQDQAGAAVVVASPVVRARETAEHVDEVLGVGVRIDERLSTSCTPGEIMEVIEELADKGVGRAVLVGHNPDMSVVVGMLAPDAATGLHTGQCVACTIDGAGVVGSGSDVEVVRLGMDT